MSYCQNCYLFYISAGLEKMLQLRYVSTIFVFIFKIAHYYNWSFTWMFTVIKVAPNLLNFYIKMSLPLTILCSSSFPIFFLIQSEKVFNFIYETNWYTYDKKITKLIDIMLVNCKKPFRLHSSTYKLPASLETFSTVRYLQLS